MNDAPSTQCLLDQLRDGDRAACRQLLDRACERLRRLAGKIFSTSFPRLQAVHDLDSVVNQAVVRLLTSLNTVKPATGRDFLCFATAQIRRVLLDMARAQTRRQSHQAVAAGDGGADSSSAGSSEPAEETLNPACLAQWTEFHAKLQTLPEELREVVDLYWYWGLTQAETARQLDVPEKTVSRRWLKARLRIADWLPRGTDLTP